MDVVFALAAFFVLVASWFALPSAPRALPKAAPAQTPAEALIQAA